MQILVASCNILKVNKLLLHHTAASGDDSQRLNLLLLWYSGIHIGRGAARDRDCMDSCFWKPDSKFNLTWTFNLFTLFINTTFPFIPCKDRVQSISDIPVLSFTQNTMVEALLTWKKIYIYVCISIKKKKENRRSRRREIALIFYFPLFISVSIIWPREASITPIGWIL